LAAGRAFRKPAAENAFEAGDEFGIAKWSAGTFRCTQRSKFFVVFAGQQFGEV
jgi:hypothetical protein